MELIQQNLKFYIPKQGKFSTFSESTDIIIPDSYPDYEETVFSCATINVKDESKQAERILVSGQLDAVILYRASDKTLHRLNVPLSFAHIEDTKGIPHSALHFLQYVVSQTDVHVINSRKINITCTCIVKPRFLQQAFNSLTTDVSSATGTLQIQKQYKKLRMISAAETTRFVILDDLELNQDVSDILHTDIHFINTNCAVSNNRVTIDGTAHFSLWWLDNESTIACKNYDIPFHQILDTHILCENTPTEVSLSCHSTICHRSSDNVLSVNFNTEALMLQYIEQDYCWISDIYDLNHELHTVFKPLSVETIHVPEKTRCSSIENISLSHDVSHVLSSRAEIISITSSEDNVANAFIFCSVLCSDDSGQLYHFQKQIPVRIECEKNFSTSALSDFSCTCDPQIQRKELSIRVDVIGTLFNQESYTLQNLEELTVKSLSPKDQHSLKILYPKEAISLWEIAKENKSTVSSIIRYNSLPENTEYVCDSIILVP